MPCAYIVIIHDDDWLGKCVNDIAACLFYELPFKHDLITNNFSSSTLKRLPSEEYS